MTRDMLDENWVLGHQSPLPASPLTTSPPLSPMSPLSHSSGSTDQLARRDITSSPALPDTSYQNHPTTVTTHHPAMGAVPATQHRLQAAEYTDGAEGLVTRATNEYSSAVVASLQPGAGGGDRAGDIRKTMKAAAIQHDVVCLSTIATL